jgi:hypothetical protein
MDSAAGKAWTPYEPGQQYPGQTPPVEPGGLATLLSRIGKVRDGLLVTATILYIVGYLVWSYNAWRNKLGLLPTLDPQYFVAGLIPVLVLSAGYLIASRLKRFFVSWLTFVGDEATGVGSMLRFVFLWGFWGVFVLFLLGPIAGGVILIVGYATFGIARWLAPGVYQSLRRFSFANAFDSALEIVRTARSRVSGKPVGPATAADQWLAVGLFSAALVAFWLLRAHRDDLSLRVFGSHKDRVDAAIALALTIGLSLLPPARDKYLSWVARSYRAFWVYVAVPLMIVLALLFYISTVYPDLPQEFGGVKPRSACLDIVRAQLSTDTLRDILPDEQISGNQPVVRSVRVEILFSGSSATLVRSRQGVHEITRSAIQAVNQCD